MKTVLLSLAALLTIGTAKAQFSMDFETNETVLTSNCWQMVNVHYTNNPAEVINGAVSMYTSPPTNGNDTRDLVTPALNVTSSSFDVSFNYRLNNALSGNATRYIEVGVLRPNGSYTILSTITMDRFTPTTVQNFSGNFELGFTGTMRLVLKMGGANGNGNVRIILDDLYVNASARYGNGTCNSAPIAVNDVFNGVIGNIIMGNVMTNDIEPNGETMTASSVLLSPQGILVMNANGSFIFTPFALFTGPTTSFTYRLSDNGMDPMTSNVATVTLNYSAGGALPVTLLSFNAMLGNNNLVNLSWTTATEQNVSHFVIEKSIDGQNYSDAAMVFAAGNSTEKKNYAHTDALGASSAKVIYYRLRTVDLDGKTQVSEARIIRTAKSSASDISILTYPNPVTSELRITIPANWQNKKVTYEIYSLNGSLTSKKENANSSQTESINVSKAAPGVYMVRVSCEGEIAQQKIVKQ